MHRADPPTRGVDKIGRRAAIASGYAVAESLAQTMTQDEFRLQIDRNLKRGSA
jgi:hypothetical protein